MQAGYICREIRGEADVERFQGQGQGGRCQKIGPSELNGCFQFSSDRVQFESAGCFTKPVTEGPGVEALQEQLDALEAEFEAYIKGEK